MRKFQAYGAAKLQTTTSKNDSTLVLIFAVMLPHVETFISRDKYIRREVSSSTEIFLNNFNNFRKLKYKRRKVLNV